jgi:hypothetical protein
MPLFSKGERRGRRLATGRAAGDWLAAPPDLLARSPMPAVIPTRLIAGCGSPRLSRKASPDRYRRGPRWPRYWRLARDDRNRQTWTGGASPGYLDALLATITGQIPPPDTPAQTTVVATSSHAGVLVERLSTRELDVLRLVSDGDPMLRSHVPCSWSEAR